MSNCKSHIHPNKNFNLINGEHLIDFLKKIKVFNGLATEELQTLTSAIKLVEFENNEVIFHARETASSLYIIAAGRVELRLIVKIYNAEETLTIDTLEKGEAFGWSVFAKPYKYTLSAYALDNIKLLQLDRVTIRKYCEKNADLGYILMNNFTSIISARFSKLEGLLQHYIIKTLADKY